MRESVLLITIEECDYHPSRTTSRGKISLWYWQMPLSCGLRRKICSNPHSYPITYSDLWQHQTPRTYCLLRKDLYTHLLLPDPRHLQFFPAVPPIYRHERFYVHLHHNNIHNFWPLNKIQFVYIGSDVGYAIQYPHCIPHIIFYKSTSILI